MANKEVIKILSENNLKVTPQRIAVLEVILGLETHPTAEEIIDYIRISFPHVPIGTIYKILDAFMEKDIIQKVKTENGIIRFDPVKKPHHHLYSTESERIEDFYDEELNKLIDNYFKKKKIPNFKIKDYKLQIVGNFTEKQ